MEENEFVIRPVTTEDFDWLFELRTQVDVGFTSLPNNEEYLANRLQTVAKSFAGDIPAQQRIFLFLRENLDTGERVGMSGIQACAGYNTIFYNFEISSITQMNREMGLQFDHKVLNLVDNFQNATELISFWLNYDHRGKRYGRPLSLARLLFIAEHKNIFGNEIIAEIRGIADDDGNSPFWEAIGRHFFGMEFVTADYLTMSTDKQFIADLIPRLPMYIELLPKSAQQVIGIAHDTATPAKNFLESQGFKYRNHIDIFDAGPLVSASVDEVSVIKSSQVAKVNYIKDTISNGKKALIGTNGFKMRFTEGDILEDDASITISKRVADILEITEGTEVRYARS